MSPLLSIIIVNYNTKDLLQQCLNSLFKAVADRSPASAPPTQRRSGSDAWLPSPGLVNIEIIIIDNNSHDGSREFLKELNPKSQIALTNKKLLLESPASAPLVLASASGGAAGGVRSDAWLLFRRCNITIKTIFNKTNLGFARANNQGIRIAKGKYILLLNSDTIIKKGALERLVDFAEKHSEAGVIAPRLLNSDGTIQPSCFHFPTPWRAIQEFWLGKKGAFLKYAPSEKKPLLVDAVVGAAFLVTPQARKRVGLLNERYFFYFEDLDYCRRVWRAGLKVYYLPKAEIVHLHGASSKKLVQKPNEWLIESSKIYHGHWRYYLITAIIRISQIWKKLLGL